MTGIFEVPRKRFLTRNRQKLHHTQINASEMTSVGVRNAGGKPQYGITLSVNLGLEIIVIKPGASVV